MNNNNPIFIQALLNTNQYNMSNININNINNNNNNNNIYSINNMNMNHNNLITMNHNVLNHNQPISYTVLPLSSLMNINQSVEESSNSASSF